jgi:hypothetical protein
MYMHIRIGSEKMDALPLGIPFKININMELI